MAQPAGKPFSQNAAGRWYEVGLCSNLDAKCANDVTCSAASWIDGATVRQSFGVPDQQSWSLVNADEPATGVSVRFGGGSECVDSGSRQTVKRSTLVTVACNPDAREPANIKWPSTSDDCSIALSFEHYSGCPSYYSTGLSGGWVFVILVLVTLLVYCGGCAAYKKATLGTSGVESVPNVEFWREFWDLVVDGCHYSYRLATCAHPKEAGFNPADLEDAEDHGEYAAPVDAGTL